ncbi:atrophin-1-like [Penaeus indicus]|uniref:atrophin-1-like n=1 Tax=Penaeus indicus TaxID=29960 RepID=UPI00300CCAB6
MRRPTTPPTQPPAQPSPRWTARPTPPAAAPTPSAPWRTPKGRLGASASGKEAGLSRRPEPPLPPSLVSDTAVSSSRRPFYVCRTVYSLGAFTIVSSHLDLELGATLDNTRPAQHPRPRRKPYREAPPDPQVPLSLRPQHQTCGGRWRTGLGSCFFGCREGYPLSMEPSLLQSCFTFHLLRYFRLPSCPFSLFLPTLHLFLSLFFFFLYSSSVSSSSLSLFPLLLPFLPFSHSLPSPPPPLTTTTTTTSSPSSSSPPLHQPFLSPPPPPPLLPLVLQAEGIASVPPPSPTHKPPRAEVVPRRETRARLRPCTAGGPGVLAGRRRARGREAKGRVEG